MVARVRISEPEPKYMAALRTAQAAPATIHDEELDDCAWCCEQLQTAKAAIAELASGDCPLSVDE